MKKVLALLLAACMIFSLAACGEKESDAKSGDAQWLNIVMTEDPSTMDIQKTTGDYEVPLNIFDTLILCVTENGEPVLKPGLATEWSVSDDGLVYNFTLREGVKFHNGNDFTAEDVKYTICDEPVSALDVSIQAQVLNLLKDLQQEMKLTYLFISHDLSVVRYLSDRVCVMFLGKICEIGETKDVYENPLHPYTKFLLEAVPKPDPNLRKEDKSMLSGEIPSPVNPPSGCRFHTRCPYATDKCSKEEPVMKEVNGRMVACHLV